MVTARALKILLTPFANYCYLFQLTMKLLTSILTELIFLASMSKTYFVHQLYTCTIFLHYLLVRK